MRLRTPGLRSVCGSKQLVFRIVEDATLIRMLSARYVLLRTGTTRSMCYSCLVIQGTFEYKRNKWRGSLGQLRAAKD